MHIAEQHVVELLVAVQRNIATQWIRTHIVATCAARGRPLEKQRAEDRA